MKFALAVLMPSSAQYRVDLLLSSSSHDGLGKQPVVEEMAASVKLPEPSALGVTDTVVMFPEYEET